MGRIHLFELEDQTWFPGILRNYGTDFLQFLANKTKMFSPLIPWIEKGLAASNTTQIIDLASGGGGSMRSIHKELLKKHPNLKILLTDFYPNLPAFEYTNSQSPNITYSSDPIDARNVPNELKGLRTLFLSFHHFRPVDGIRILESACQTRQPILIAEGQERSVRCFLSVFFSPIIVLLTTPFIRPFSFGRLIFTYLIPIVPVFVWWDGMVSCMRIYSLKELKVLVNQVNQNEKFDWEIGKIKSGPSHLVYLLGTPKLRSAL